MFCARCCFCDTPRRLVGVKAAVDLPFFVIFYESCEIIGQTDSSFTVSKTASEPDCLRNEPDNVDLVKRRCVELEADIRAFLFGVLRNVHDVEDAFQRTVVKAIESSSDVDPETLRGWLFKIALNEARATKRSQSLAKKKVDEWKTEFGMSRTAVDDFGLDSILSKEQQESIESAVLRLPKDQREVVERRIQKGQKFADIATEMDRPIGTILTWMRRALNGLREMQEIRDLDPASGSIRSKVDRQDAEDFEVN